MMNVKLKKIASSALCGLLACSLLITTGTFAAFASTLNKWITGDNTITTPIKSSESEQIGSEENPLLILEIVPSRADARIGYYIPGCEPIDLTQAGDQNDSVTELMNAFTNSENQVFSTQEETEYAFFDKIPTDSHVYASDNNWNAYRTSELVFDNSMVNYGQWQQIKNSGNYSEKGYYKRVKAGDGDFTWTSNTENVTYTPGTGNAKWVEDNSEGQSTEQIFWTTRTDETVFKKVKVQFTNTNKLISSIYSSSTDFTTKVVTLTLAELDQSSKTDLIDEADLIYIHDGQDDTALSKVQSYYELLADNDSTNDPGDFASYRYANTTFKTQDVSSSIVKKIMERMASTDPAALMVDSHAVLGSDFNGTYQTNLQKLYLMAMQYQATEFMSLFKDSVFPKSLPTNLTFNNSVAWTNDTFKKVSGEDVSMSMHYQNVVVSGVNLVDTIFTYDSDSKLTSNLLTGGAIANHDYVKNSIAKNVTSEAFDYYENTESGSKTSLTYMEALVYILKQTYRTSIRILELQPCNSFIYSKTSTDWVETYQEMFPWLKVSSDDMQVDTMTMWQFIGSTGIYDYTSSETLTSSSSDDLISKYDLIFIGANQDATNGKDGYNDTNMENLVYSGIGDLAATSGTASMNDSYQIIESKVRYSGNDLTLKKMLELEDFLKAGHAIVVDDDLYTFTDGNVEVDTDKVDSSSKLYQLLKWEEDGSKNRFIYQHTNPSEMKRSIGMEQCNLVFADTDSYPEPYSEGITPLTKNDDGTITLKYHFKINGTANKTYEVTLNVDANGDGVYSDSLLQQTEIDNMNVAMGLTGDNKYKNTTDEKQMTLTVKDKDGNSINSKELKAGIDYYAQRDIPKSQQGIIPWKLEINCVQNTYLRSSAINYALSKSTEGEKINVLQIRVTADMANGDTAASYSSKNKLWEIFLPFTNKYVLTDSTYESTKNYPDFSGYMDSIMTTNQKITTDKFTTYFEPVKEFNINIQFLFNGDWYTMFAKNSLGDEKNLANWKDFLSKYDMLICGFSDNTGFTNNEILVAGIQDFIDQGKSVIFSHDMVSDPTVNSSTYTSWLRTVTGQRRAYYNLKENGTYEKSYWETNLRGVTIDVLPTFKVHEHNPKISYLHVNCTSNLGGTNAILDPIKDNDASEYGDNSTAVSLRTLTGIRNQYINSNNLKSDRLTKEWSKGTSALGMDGVYNSTDRYWQNYRDTSYVAIANNGQITNYPYKLGNVIEVLQTHTQYYQLDLEFQSAGDVNVWYNLTDKNSKKYGSELSNTDANDTDIYSTREDDCRNNFYIYTKGNITYTGLGHDYGYKNKNISLLTNDEVKLFVNTMISSYRQVESKPFTTLTDADAVTKDGTSVVYVDYDENHKNQVVDGNVTVSGGVETIPVSFKVYDITTNAAQGKEYYLYFTDEDGETLKDVDLYKGSVKQTSTEGLFKVNASDAGVEYTINIPYSQITGSGVTTHSIHSYATFPVKGDLQKTGESVSKTEIRLLPLFNLD